jgi:large subunit ribosomal protein L3
LLEKSAEVKVGAEIKASVFQPGEDIEVQGESKGKGFQGVMKRWHFAGGADSHGCSVSHRAPGSIGQRAYPGRVMKGMRMGGHMGADTVTIKNLKIVAVEAEQNLVLIKGAIPGANNSRVVIYSQAKDFVSRVLNSVKAPEPAVA